MRGRDSTSGQEGLGSTYTEGPDDTKTVCPRVRSVVKECTYSSSFSIGEGTHMLNDTSLHLGPSPTTRVGVSGWRRVIPTSCGVSRVHPGSTVTVVTTTLRSRSIILLVRVVSPHLDSGGSTTEATGSVSPDRQPFYRSLPEYGNRVIRLGPKYTSVVNSQG